MTQEKLSNSNSTIPVLDRALNLMKLVHNFFSVDELIKNLPKADGNETSEHVYKDAMKLLKRGFTFYGWEIAYRKGLPKMRSDRNNPDLSASTFHPIFLCLNLHELIVLVDSISENDNSLRKHLLGLIKPQLSQYAFEKLEGKFERIRDVPLKNRSEKEMRAIYESEMNDFILKRESETYEFLIHEPENSPKSIRGKNLSSSKGILTFTDDSGVEQKYQRSAVKWLKRIKV